MISKTCMITICGRPNVGKSTLANTLAGEKIAIVSDKPQTTRNRITAICSRGETQFVFMDTPGFHKPRTRLGDYMVGVVRQSVADVDAVVLVVEPVASLGPQERELIRGFSASGVPFVKPLRTNAYVTLSRICSTSALFTSYIRLISPKGKTAGASPEVSRQTIPFSVTARVTSTSPFVPSPRDLPARNRLHRNTAGSRQLTATAMQLSASILPLSR